MPRGHGGHGGPGGHGPGGWGWGGFGWGWGFFRPPSRFTGGLMYFIAIIAVIIVIANVIAEFT